MSVARQIVDASKATLNALESRLAGVLKPVPPRKEFVDTLGNQIQIIHQQPTMIYRLTNAHFLLILVAGIVSMGALLVIGLRTVLSLVNIRRRIVRNG